jgi:hypothetical protein
VGLPAAGTYRVRASLRGLVSDSGTGFISYRFFNTTAGSVIANTEVVGCLANANVAVNTQSMEMPVTVTGASTVVVEVMRSTTTPTLYEVNSDGNGRSYIYFERMY